MTKEKGKKLEQTLAKLAKMNGGGKKTQGNKFWKANEGKSYLLFLPTEQGGDPFVEWWVHQELADPKVPFKSIGCNNKNLGEACVVCEMIEDLKADGAKQNEFLWKKIDSKKEFYSPVVDLKNVEGGVQWWRYGRAVSTQLELWLQNLEDDENPFYDSTEPQKIVVTFEKNAAPKDKYKLDKKALEPFDEEQYDLWFDQIKPISEVCNNTRTDEELSEMLAVYIKTKEAEVDAVDVEESRTVAKKKRVVEEEEEAPVKRKTEVVDRSKVTVTPKVTSKAPWKDSEEEEEEAPAPKKVRSSRLEALKDEE